MALELLLQLMVLPLPGLALQDLMGHHKFLTRMALLHLPPTRMVLPHLLRIPTVLLHLLRILMELLVDLIHIKLLAFTMRS